MTKKDPDFEVDGYKDFVFVSHITGKCMNHNSVRRMLKAIVDMNCEREIQLPNISPHILRHTACCRFAESGCDIKVLQYLMGQTDIKTTMRVYSHVDLGRVKRELGKLENTSKYAGKAIPEFTQKFTHLQAKVCRFIKIYVDFGIFPKKDTLKKIPEPP